MHNIHEQAAGRQEGLHPNGPFRRHKLKKAYNQYNKLSFADADGPQQEDQTNHPRSQQTFPSRKRQYAPPARHFPASEACAEKIPAFQSKE
jgi:hypothetical protein